MTEHSLMEGVNTATVKKRNHCSDLLTCASYDFLNLDERGFSLAQEMKALTHHHQ